jgi:small subunit ribosomal protein S17
MSESTETTAAEATSEATETDTAEVAASETATEAAAADQPGRHARKVREGVVTSAAMDKTIIVTVTDRVRHAKYNKFVLRTKKLYAHDESNDAGLGDKVRVMETRPLSKSKRWRLVDVLERAR